MLGAGDTSSSEIQRLDAEADAWLAKHWPAISSGLQTLPEDWLIGVISGSKPYGLDQTVLEVVWHAARDRAYRAAGTEIRMVEANFSGTGWGLPPGALVGAVNAAEQRASQAIAEVNWQQAIKDADIKIDLLKFAEEQAVRLKLGVMQQMADFYRMWYAVPDRDIERARVRAQLIGTFYDALRTYHSVELNFEALRLEVAKGKIDVGLAYDRSNVAMVNGANTASSLGQVAQGFAEIAASSAGAASSLVAKIEDI